MSALLAGAGVDEVAAQYKLPPQTVWEWRRHATSVSEVVQSEKTADLGVLIADHLTESLTTLTALSRFYRDVEWLRLQSAADLAVLFGVISDKTVRILSALQPVDLPEGGPD